MYATIINLEDKHTRLEMTAKPFAIFKSATFQPKGKPTPPPTQIVNWCFSKVKENNKSQLEVDGKVEFFPSLQAAFNHAEKKELLFL